MSSLTRKDQAQQTNLTSQSTGISAAMTLNSAKDPNKGINGLNKIVSAVEKINETNRETAEKEQKAILINRTLKFKTDKKEIAALSKIFQSTLESLEESNRLDLEDCETCELVIFLLQKPIKTAQEVSFLGKFMKGLSLFSQREELFQAQKLSSKLIQNLRCVFIQKQNSLFRYGDRGHEYFILLKGKAYCLVPYSNLIPMEQINTQTKNNRLLNQVTEDEEDEEFLFDQFPRHQCVKIYHPGEAFGEIALLTSESKRMASIVCKVDSWFMSLDREGFKQIQGSYQQHLLNERVYFLKKYEIFGNIAVNKILSFLHDMSESSYHSGQSIYEQGDKLQYVYFIMEGEVELTYRVSQQYPSRLDKQKYEKYFHNTKTCNFIKEIVILSRGNYFGDEDLLSPGLRRSFSATVRSPSCKLMIVDSKQLAQFLKVSERFQIFKNTANSKRERYIEIIEQFNLEHSICDINSRDTSLNNNNDNVKDNNQKENNDFIKKTSIKAIPANSIVQPPQVESLIEQENLGMPSSRKQEHYNEGMSKFHNLYTQQGNANMRTKNYLSLHLAHNNACKFTINDVPMTSTMNQHPNDLKKTIFRLKNKQISVLQPEQSQSHHSFEQQSKLKIAENLVKHSLAQSEADVMHLPQLYQLITQQKEEYQLHLQQQQKQELQELTKQSIRFRQTSIEQNLIRYNSVIQESSARTTPLKELPSKIARTSLSPQLKIKAEYSINHQNDKHFQDIHDDPYFEPKYLKSSSTSSSRILGQLTKKMLKSSESVSKLFKQSAWNLSPASKHTQNFLSYLSSNLISKNQLNNSNTTIDDLVQKQEQKLQPSLPLISSELKSSKSQKSLVKRSSLLFNHSHFLTKSAHSRDQEVASASAARIDSSHNQEYQVLKNEEIRKRVHISFRKANDDTLSSASSFRNKIKRFNISPDKFTIQNSVSITSNEYQQNLLLRKHFSLIEQD